MVADYIPIIGWAIGGSIALIDAFCGFNWLYNRFDNTLRDINWNGIINDFSNFNPVYHNTNNWNYVPGE